jgi:hypothetical protein
MPGHVVGMGVAFQQDLDIADLETERLDRCADEWRRFLEAAVDRNVTLGCRDQVARQLLRAHVIDVSDHAVGRRPACPTQDWVVNDPGQLVWPVKKFDRLNAGPLHFACHVPVFAAHAARGGVSGEHRNMGWLKKRKKCARFAAN